MDTYPITARSLGLYFKVDGNNLERAYKDHLSGFRNWEQASHAEDWVLHPKNIGKRLGIDETMLHKDLMTFLTNKEGHGKRHTLIAAVKAKTLRRFAQVAGGAKPPRNVAATISENRAVAN